MESEICSLVEQVEKVRFLNEYLQKFVEARRLFKIPFVKELSVSEWTVNLFGDMF